MISCENSTPRTLFCPLVCPLLMFLSHSLFHSWTCNTRQCWMQLTHPPCRAIAKLGVTGPHYSALVANCETQPPASIGWVALSSMFVRSFVPHRWHLLSSPLYDVSDHTNHIFSVKIWSWQHVSVIHCWVEPSLLLSSLLHALGAVHILRQPPEGGEGVR